MSKIIPTYTIKIPNYDLKNEPDHKAVGKMVDDEIKKRFAGQTILVRGVGSQEHPNMTVDELIETIKMTGTDRYDVDRVGDRYENVGEKQIDMFALRRKVAPSSKIFWQLSWSFYNFPPKDRGPVKVDVLIIYDPAKLKAVVHQYQGSAKQKRDGYIFKDQDSKQDAVLAIFKII